MFESGLLEETKELLQKYGEAARPLTSLGYKQAVQLLQRRTHPATKPCRLRSRRIATMRKGK